MNIPRYITEYRKELELKNYSKNTIKSYMSLVSLFLKAFTGIVASIKATLPEAGNEGDIAKSWPLGQACNLREYLGNHAGAAGLGENLRSDIALIQTRLGAYFQRPDSYVCSGMTRYQHAGAAHD